MKQFIAAFITDGVSIYQLDLKLLVAMYVYQIDYDSALNKMAPIAYIPAFVVKTIRLLYIEFRVFE